MKNKIIIVILLLAFLMPVQPVKAATVNLYIVPVEHVGNYRGPEYFQWRFDQNGPSLTERWDAMYYGSLDYVILLAFDMTPEDHASLISHADVYAFPANLDQNISDKTTIDNFFEGVNIPTDWVTPANTYRQLLRKTAGLMQLNQRYESFAAIDGVANQSFLGGGITLDSNFNNLSQQQKAWFNATLVSFGGSNVKGNPKLRTIIKTGSDLWGNAPFYLGGFEF